MTRKAIIAILILLAPGALILVGGLIVLGYYRILRSIRTSDPYLEQYRPLLARFVVLTFGAGASVPIARAMIGIFDRENKARQRPPVVGDKLLPGGPSIGPGQVYRATAIDLGFVPAGITREDYAMLAYDDSRMVWWAVKVFRAKLAAAGGDVGEAIRRYNGSGPEAERYASEVIAWLAETFGADPIGPKEGMVA